MCALIKLLGINATLLNANWKEKYFLIKKITAKIKTG